MSSLVGIMCLRSLVTPGLKRVDFSLGIVDELSCRSEGDALCLACFGVYQCMRNGYGCQGSCVGAARPRRLLMLLRRVSRGVVSRCQRHSLCAMLTMCLPWSPISLGELRFGCGQHPFYQCSLRALWFLLGPSSRLGQLFSLQVPRFSRELMWVGPTFSAA